MATEIVPQAAQGGMHDAIRVDTDGPPAAIFNPEAGVPDLLSYAHGQLTILTEVLLGLERKKSPALHYALRAIVAPAVTAIEIATEKVEEAARVEAAA